MLTVIGLGGSIVAPEQPDTEFLLRFREVIRAHLHAGDNRVIIIVGGGRPARTYQKALREISPDAAHDAQDRIGIAATRLNAALVRELFADEVEEDVIRDPADVTRFTGRVLVAGGWKPGFSTDNVAVVLSRHLGATRILNLSNISQVYSDDPKKNPDATPLEHISWADYRKMAGEDWKPGVNLPFDPVATRAAAELGLEVITAAGTDLENLGAILRGDHFNGTTIS